MNISVVIPTYQRREQVLVAVSSALDQRHRPAEVIVVDDGSTDGTAAAVDQRFGDAVQVVQRPNRGPAAARNAGIARAGGELVAFLDSDNRWRPHHLEVICELAERCPDAVLVGTHRRYQVGGERPAVARSTDLARDLLLARVAVGAISSVAARRDALMAAGCFDEAVRFSEDTDLYRRLAVVGPMALISARTYVRGESVDSLGAIGRRTGAYLERLCRDADSAIELARRRARPDLAVLVAAAAARRAIGHAIIASEQNEPVSAVRSHLTEAARHTAAAGAVMTTDTSDWVFGLVVRTFPDRDVPGRRLQMLSLLARAWPDQASRPATHLRLAAFREHVRQRRWSAGLRLAPGLMNRDAGYAVMQWLLRRARLGLRSR